MRKIWQPTRHTSVGRKRGGPPSTHQESFNLLSSLNLSHVFEYCIASISMCWSLSLSLSRFNESDRLESGILGFIFGPKLEKFATCSGLGLRNLSLNPEVFFNNRLDLSSPLLSG